ncbi:MAG: DNA gyrase subunit A [Candidatus Yonathbacteria bacterium CG_4_10_14_3_um_filter_47_65]|uniref:DNA gyrase subunit A n=2 Tax=Parcubacteria group TaxID=1794811 RepID=A0A2M8D8Y4_9BACT|nr:MAG: DNA gyrase subunit A [Candidatus Nomurabacteria bacterium CG1_02_47_685]PIP03939.1 MAG: DNA gyrase subunit A [Candidatus Yonathbacteria bacterium CG23_combo_of_CG06-09_8_20_14_all_46_18]PIQ32495.1 MAG: DNA gyrase subunit A [Candidatus Yonathbacteria bacterium CG17_big_fil_post_rev_8_21_14_2_50_46_19]PIX56031.1 MAG: DNA gyrase subunit A [Candidatus Yonathbacteria bacterium CG_4_10_14_3_um_filter_47_65]PIY57288.1 MAG: DNA gyrase subunit A [Candidatus Yonathbacteria bacterium CG_4_10_14_0_
MSRNEAKINDPDAGKNNEEKGIIPVDIGLEMRESYLNYAMSVITSRALPDVRDGLKPVHRRILYSMNEIGLGYSAKFRKSAAVVGDVLGKYHPHGDASVYDAMVKMAQDFSMRYPLVVGQGNFGSVDGDSPAAMRYTEVKMSRLSSEILSDLEKNTVTFVPNYDGTKKEPTVLPSTVPNLLLNGTFGIAVGMSTNIPPHNLREVIDATICLLYDERATTDDLMKFIKGPDFPTGGMVFGEKDIHHAYASGRGGVVCRGEAEIVDEGNTNRIIIHSLPFRVNKAELIVRIADLVREKKVEGVKGLRDESTRDVRVVIDLKSGSYPQKVLNYLYKHTDLETAFHYNMLALVDGVPQTLSVKALLGEFIKHRVVVVTRRTQFDLEKAEAREHILLGLKKALDHIDQIIKLIKASKDTPAAHRNLMKEFRFSEKQATAILEMKLQKLAGLERKQVELELKEKQALIKELKTLLASPQKIRGVIKDELSVLKEKFGDDRKTKVIRSGAKMISAEDIVPDEDSILIFTKGGYVKRTNPNEYRQQKRGGIGVIDLNTKDEDFITLFLSTNTHSNLLFFSDKGKAYQTKMYDIPEGRRATKGKSIMNFLSLIAGENITSILAVPREVGANSSLLMVTKNGVIKKVPAGSFKDVRRSGLIVIRLTKGDELLNALFVEKGDSIILATAQGQSIRFKESDVRQMGRAAGGVRGIKLGSGDVVAQAGVVRNSYENSRLLVMSQNGFGKTTPIKEYKVQKRGGTGIKTAKVTAKTGGIILAKVVTDEDSELIVISKKSQVIRTELKDIPTLGRQTQGVRIMKLRSEDEIASFVCF